VGQAIVFKWPVTALRSFVGQAIVFMWPVTALRSLIRPASPSIVVQSFRLPRPFADAFLHAF